MVPFLTLLSRRDFSEERTVLTVKIVVELRDNVCVYSGHRLRRNFEILPSVQSR